MKDGNVSFERAKHSQMMSKPGPFLMLTTSKMTATGKKWTQQLWFIAQQVPKTSAYFISVSQCVPDLLLPLSKHSLTFPTDAISPSPSSVEIERVKRKPVSPSVQTTFQ